MPNKGRGRPPGAKNKATLFKEVVREGFEKKLQRDFKKVLDTVVDRAVKGDMKAAKLLLDRVIPMNKAIDATALSKGGLEINISVGRMEDNIEAIEADFTEVNEDGKG